MVLLAGGMGSSAVTALTDRGEPSSPSSDAHARLLRANLLRTAPPAGLPLPPPPAPKPAATGGTAEEPQRAVVGRPSAKPRPPPPLPARPVPAPEADPAPPSPVAGPEPAAPPSAGVTFRRDPLVPPLTEAERWRELLLSVAINGYAVSDAAFFIEDPTNGRLAVELATVRRWRLRLDEDRVLTFQGLPFYPLDAIGGVEVALDRQELALDLVIPPETFEPYVIDPNEREGVDPQVSYGAFLDYDLLLSDDSAQPTRVEGLAEVGVFTPHGVALSSFKAEDLLDDPDLVRLETSFSRDFPKKRATLTLGDSLSVGGAFATGTRFAGANWFTDFGLDPGFVPFPLPAIGGLAEQQSLVDVLVDNFTRATETVPPGPFRFNNLPVLTGSGEVQLKVTDLLGRERLLTRSYYVSPRLLRQGLHDFAYAVGFEREDYGTEDFDYGKPLASLTHRYGITDGFTGEAHAEANPDHASLAAGGVLGLGVLGVLSGGVGGSVGEGGTSGLLAQLAYEYDSRPFSASLATRYTSEGFRQFGDTGLVRRTDQLSLGVNLEDLGQVGLLLLNRELVDLPDTRSMSLSYSVPLGPGSLILNAAKTLEPDGEAALTATYALPLGGRRSSALRAARQSGEWRGFAQYHQGRDRTDLGLDWRVAAETGGETGLSAGLDYQAEAAGATLDVERTDGDVAARAGVNGSLVWLGGDLLASRRLGRGFGLVDLPGFADVRIYVDNREVGRTNEDGRLLLPRLRPYEPNKVSLALEDLPLEAGIATTETITSPAARSGTLIRLAVDDAVRSIAVLRDSDGRPLPAGLRLEGPAGEIQALVAREGLAQIEGPQAQEVRLEGQMAGRRYVCLLPPLEGGGPMPDRGDLTCTG